MNKLEVIAIFESAGMVNANGDISGTVDQLLAGSKQLIEECAVVAENEERGTRYQWVNGSLFQTLTNQIAAQIRRTKTFI